MRAQSRQASRSPRSCASLARRAARVAAARLRLALSAAAVPSRTARTTSARPSSTAVPTRSYSSLSLSTASGQADLARSKWDGRACRPETQRNRSSVDLPPRKGTSRPTITLGWPVMAWSRRRVGLANPRDARFAKNILVVAPGLTVRSRLAVLKPSHPENCYEQFRVVPPALRDKLRRGKVVIRNWHALNWETDRQEAGRRQARPQERRRLCQGSARRDGGRA